MHDLTSVAFLLNVVFVMNDVTVNLKILSKVFGIMLPVDSNKYSCVLPQVSEQGGNIEEWLSWLCLSAFTMNVYDRYFR